MDITHPQMVSALVKQPLDIMTTLSQFSTDLWHGATGISGECGELLEMMAAFYDTGMDLASFDRENFVEEMGDIEFYMQQIRLRLTKPRDNSVTIIAFKLPISPDLSFRYAAQAAIHGSQILDAVKKCAIYNKALDEVLLLEQMTMLDVYLEALLLMFGYDRQEVLEANIAKLSKRYAGLSYSYKASQQRADKAPARKPFPGEPLAGVDDGGLDHVVTEK
jgi:hypothetical protein